MDPNALGPWFQGGGLLAFATAVFMQVRELVKLLRQQNEILTRLDERTKGLATEDEDPTPPSRPARRKLVVTPVRGVRTRAAPDTEEDGTR